MLGFKELKNWIGSVKFIQKIIKVKQMVVVVKLCCVQEVVEVFKLYVSCMVNVVVNLIVLMGEGLGGLKFLVGFGDDKVYLLVVMIVECGLCGGFNVNIVKVVCLKIEEFKVVGKEVKIIIVGKKGCEVLKVGYVNLFIDYVDLFDVKDQFILFVIGFGYDLIKCFEDGEFDVVILIFFEFKNVLMQILVLKQLILVEVLDDVEMIDFSGVIYVYELLELEILEVLLLCYLNMQILFVMLENVVGE